MGIRGTRERCDFMKKFIVLLLILCGNSIFSMAAVGGTVRLEFNLIYGDDAPLGDGPWMIATFEDLGSDRVLLTIENLLSSDSEHVKQVDFNLNPIFDPDDLEIEQRIGGAQTKEMDAVENAFKAGSAKGFDIEMEWDNKKNKRFDGGDGEIVQFEFSGITGLTAESFLFLNNGNKHGHGPENKYFAAAHIGGIGDDDDSTWIAPAEAPLPPAAFLIGAGLVLVPLMRRRLVAS